MSIIHPRFNMSITIHRHVCHTQSFPLSHTKPSWARSLSTSNTNIHQIYVSPKIELQQTQGSILARRFNCLSKSADSHLSNRLLMLTKHTKVIVTLGYLTTQCSPVTRYALTFSIISLPYSDCTLRQRGHSDTELEMLTTERQWSNPPVTQKTRGSTIIVSVNSCHLHFHAH